jgi:hypothetical protein
VHPEERRVSTVVRKTIHRVKSLTQSIAKVAK